MVTSDTDILDLQQEPILLDSGCRRSNTVALRYRAVQRAISTMHERYMEQLTLPEIADAAQLSPFHFDRVFRSMIGVSPGVFLASIRMKEAKRFLLMTKHSVTDICFDVGYTSLGTFSSRFTLLVGLPPGRFRRLAHEQIMRSSPHDMQSVVEHLQQRQAPFPGEGIRGTVHTTVPLHGLIFVGLFSSPLPQGQPVGCTILTSGGRFCIPSVPDGTYHLFSAAMDQSQDFFTILAEGPRLHGGRGTPTVVVSNGRTSEEREIVLAPPSWADPAITFAFPWLFMKLFHHYAG